MTQETYPSGRVVKNTFDSNGDLARIHGTATSSATERTYANSFRYLPDGRIERLKIGNGLWEKAKFNDRLQVTEFGLGRGADNMNLWKINLEYGELQTNGTVDTSKNTGNLAKQTISFEGLAQPFIQTYKYDSLYRLKEAKETNNNNQNWIQNFDYDRYGNRTTISQNINGQQLAINNITHPTIDQNTNRFNDNQGYLYDKVGNLTADAEDRSFTFDGNNKQILVTNVNNQAVGEYYYDGDGKRVKKKVYQGGVHSKTVIFVYSRGKLVEEFSTQTPPTNPTTKYVVTDHLQSVRAISNQDGEVISRRDFLPFGEELPSDNNLRKTDFKYAETTDGVRQKFTGYEKDDETGLDFAEARMYQNQHARFTAVDPLLASGKSRIPQTFNRFVYVANRPLVFTDATGLQMSSCLDCDIYTDKEKRRYVIGPRKGYTKYNGPKFTRDFTDGYRYTITSNSRLKIGRTSEFEARKAASRTKNIGRTRLLLNQLGLPPLGRQLEQRMQKELELMANEGLLMLKNGAYRFIPDNVGGAVELPFYSGGFEVSKDGNFFGGGNFTIGTDISDWYNAVKKSNKVLKPKLSAGFSLTYFEGNLDEGQRDAAISGQDFELQIAYVTLVKPFTGDGPRSIKIGKAGYGAGASFTSEKLVDGGDVINALTNYFTPSQFVPRKKEEEK